MFIIGCAEDVSSELSSEENIDKNIYYGDIFNDEILIIDRETMLLEKSITSNAHYPYEIAQAPDAELAVINRDDFQIGLMKDSAITSTIDLPFKPRSIAINAHNILASSVNESSALIINNQRLSSLYGDSTYTLPTSYGGAGASGHPVWINESYFLLLDRTENAIELYKLGEHKPISKLITKSSVHHVMKEGKTYYGICEGVQNGSAPGVIKFTVAYEKITLDKERLISEFTDVVSDINSSTWGAHHGAIHPDGQHLYFGSREGNIFVLDLETLNLVDNFKSGLGIGHIIFYKNLLVTTNHYDNFKSFYNSKNPKNNILVTDLYFSDKRYDDIVMQSHTTHIVDNYLYFMFNEDNGSTFYKIDLKDVNNIHIDSQLKLPGRRALMGSLLQLKTQALSDM